MAKGFRVRDPVHNFINLREKEVKLIGTPVFQRLRGIRQLAMAHLVYPGALHTRFDHSLGVCHVAGLLAEQLGLDNEQIELVRLAALLHDLGHGPFSHVSEDALERYTDRSLLPANQKREKIHELITGYLLRTDPEIRRILGQDLSETVATLLAEGHGQPALRAIVSGPLDADKQDYLLRDSYFCGVAYGVFDIHQLHRSLVPGGPKDEEELMIDPDGIHAVEQYVLAKYYLITNVYGHRVRLITDQMIVRAIKLGIELDRVANLRKLYSYNGSPEFFKNYQGWDDERFLAQFGRDAPDRRPSGQLLRRLQQRNLLKRVFSCPIREFGKSELAEALLKLGARANDQARAGLERSIADILPKQEGQSVDPRFVIVHAYTIRSVRVASRNDEGSIMVATHPEPRPFEQESSLFASINEGYTEGYVEVYAPMAWGTPTEKKRILRDLHKPIRERIEALSVSNKEGA